MGNSLLPPLPAQPETPALPQLVSPGALPGPSAMAPPDPMEGYLRVLQEAHMGIEEIARGFASRPDITEAAQMALEGVRNLMHRIITSADPGVNDATTPIGG